MSKLSCVLIVAAAMSCLPAWSSVPYSAEENNFFDSIGQAESGGQISHADAQKYRKQLADLRAREKVLAKGNHLGDRETASIKDELTKLETQLKTQVADSDIQPNTKVESEIERKISSGQLKGRIDFTTAQNLVTALNQIRVVESKLIVDGKYTRAEKARIAQQLQQLQAKLNW